MPSPSLPRVLTVQLAAPPGRAAGARLAAAIGPFADPDPALERLARASGEALALCILLSRARRTAPAAAPATAPTAGPPAGPALPFVVAVGEGVRRGLPTATRATLATVAPLSGLFAGGQVGGELGRRLARVADALVLEGRAPPGSVLVLEEDGTARLERAPFAPLDPPARRLARLTAQLGPGAGLVAGPAAERGAPFANLASGDPPSFVGRGGLGAALVARGLSGLLVRAEPVPQAPGGELQRALLGSPRLRARAEGGTLELLHAQAARGELAGLEGSVEEGGRGTGAALAAAGARLAAEAGELARGRHGCRGCPTPCGWVFGTESGGARGARFGALEALGPVLGWGSLGELLPLLERCDRLGIDAKEAGAALAVAVRAREQGLTAGPPLAGDLGALLALLEGPAIAAGAPALARALGLADPGPRVRGQALRPARSLAMLLGQCASARGADPMRSATHVLLDVPDRAGLEELVAPMELPPGAEDPLDPAGKGRLVAFGEALSAAVDATGFCAFSAAGLLADGVLPLDALARSILPAELAGAPRPGRRLLALGASIALAARELEQRLGAPPDVDRPGWARAELDLSGMLDEHRLARGLDGAGRPLPEALALLGSEGLLELGLGALAAADGRGRGRAAAGARAGRAGGPGGGPGPAGPAAGSTAPAGPPRRGRVLLRAVGSLGGALEGALGGARGGPAGGAALTLPLPAALSEVLAGAAREAPRAAPFLVRDGRPVALAYRDGARLWPGDPVRDGDRLDLVVAIGGG